MLKAFTGHIKEKKSSEIMEEKKNQTMSIFCDCQ